MKLFDRHIGVALVVGLVFAWGNALAQGEALSATGVPPPLTPIQTLDVPRYTGVWYEIARYPNRFQQQCVRDSQAEYRIQEDGRIQVINRCTLADGRIDEAVGVAYQQGSSASAQLKVRFAPAWLSFLPSVWGDYWVIDLDPGYQLVAVSEPRRKYLWILARTPQVESSAYEQLLARLARQGFAVDRLVSERPVAP